MSEYESLIEDYMAGPKLLRKAVAGMTDEQLRAAPIAGKWSTLQVVCHIADFEPVYCDRITRCIAEDNPVMAPGDPDVFAARLAYESRNIEEELQLIEAVRNHLGRILRSLPSEIAERTGRHSIDGPLTIEETLRRIARHIPHHIKYIEEKRAALGVP